MGKIINGLVKNEPGVLAAIAEKFRELNINISSIATGSTDDDEITHITLVTEVNDVDLKKIEESLSHMMEIQKLELLGQGDHYERELVLIKVGLEKEEISHIMQVAEVFQANVVGVGKKSITLQYVAETEQIEGFIKMLEPFGLVEVARTGRTAIKKDE